MTSRAPPRAAPAPAGDGRRAQGGRVHPRRGAGGSRAARSMPRRPSAGRRARRRAAGPARGARAAPARRGTCGSARRRRRRGERSLARRDEGTISPSSATSSALQCSSGRAPARRRMRPSHRSTRRTAPRARTPSPRLVGRDSPAPPPGGAPRRAGGSCRSPARPRRRCTPTSSRRETRAHRRTAPAPTRVRPSARR